MLLGMLVGCQVAPVPPAWEGFRAEEAKGGLALVVQARSPRRPLAFVEQVTQVTVEVAAANGARFDRRFSLADGAASTTIEGLVPGGAAVTLRAYDASDHLLGEMVREVVVVPGVVTPLTMSLRLDHRLPSEPVMPLPSGTVPAIAAAVEDIEVGAGFRRLMADPTGAIWLHGDALIQLSLDGSEMRRVPSAWGASIAVDHAGRLWVSDGSVRVYNADGSIAWQIANLSGTVAVEADGHALIANGGLSRVSPAGEVVEVLDIQGAFHEVVPNGGNIWVVDNRALLRQYAPDGGLLSKTMIPLDARFINRWDSWYPEYDGRRFRTNELALDVEGNAWLVGIDEAKISKVGADGTLLGEYVVCVEPTAVTVDREGNIWVGGRGTGEGNLVKLAPDGTMLGALTVRPGIQSLETDVEGNIWVAYGSQNHVTKVTP
ncbi:MAG: hypothetical protein ACLGIN_12390 [Candidatus Sericytochromatia bacterium]